MRKIQDNKALLKETARLLRLGYEQEFQLMLKLCIEALTQRVRELEGPQLSSGLASMKKMLASQKNHDWLGLADTLEYELIDLLDQ